jgi:hypothetical protein
MKDIEMERSTPNLGRRVSIYFLLLSMLSIEKYVWVSTPFSPPHNTILKP